MKSIIKLLLPAVIMVTATGYSSAASHSNNKTSISDIVDRHLSGFHAVDLAGSFDVYLTQGATESVKVEAPADIIPHIKTEVENGILKIYNKNDGFHWGDMFGHHQKIRVNVMIINIDAISVTGSGDMFFKEGLHAGSLKLNVSGSGDLMGGVEVKTVESNISGSGDMKLSGHAETAIVTVVGSGDYTAKNLTTFSTSVHVSGSGDADVYASDKINASVVGSGDIHYGGHPKHVNKRKSGSGDIDGD